MVQPNHGASVPDIVAIGSESENVTQWQERFGIKKENQIRLVKLAHMRYQHPDLDQITTFLEGVSLSHVLCSSIVYAKCNTQILV
jgi:hypothetical protein